jgi:transcriptional regulator with XRE-family HTH domain
VVGEMIACAPQLSIAPRQQHLVDLINAWSTHITGEKGRALARYLRLSRSAIYAWRRQGGIPRFETLLRLCHLLHTSPLCLLTQGIAAVDVSQVDPSQLPAPRSDLKRPRRLFDHEGVRQALEVLLANDLPPPPSMRQVTRQLGYSHRSLYHYCPGLCRAISARYMAYRKQQGELKRQRLCEEVRQAVAHFHAQGIYPSGARVASRLRVPGAILHPEARAVWHQLLRELGWER